MKITKKRHLEMKLQAVPPHPSPKVGLEQYSTPSVIAADLIWNAWSLGDIEGRTVVDLGCGSGIFTAASALMGADMAVGVDVDADSVELACETSRKLNLDCTDYILSDVCDFNPSFRPDTVIQNPPFGSQKKAKKGPDLKFVKKAVSLEADVIYSFHMASTEEFLINFYLNARLSITHAFRYRFPMPRIYEFHTKEKHDVDVIVFRAVSDF